MFLKNIDQIHDIEWGRSYLWDLMFQDYPGSKIASVPQKFSQWFPATEVNENICTLNSTHFDVYTSGFSVPQATTEADITVTFIDDSDHSLENWLSSWVDAIVTASTNVLWLESSVKILNLVKLTPKKEKVTSKSYLVYPDGAFYYQGTSEGNVVSFAVKFLIAGTV